MCSLFKKNNPCVSWAWAKSGRDMPKVSLYLHSVLLIPSFFLLESYELRRDLYFGLCRRCATLWSLPVSIDIDSFHDATPPRDGSISPAQKRRLARFSQTLAQNSLLGFTTRSALLGVITSSTLFLNMLSIDVGSVCDSVSISSFSISVP